MKKTLLFICTLLLTVGSSFAQVYVFEPFDYGSIGTTLLDGTRTNPVTGTAWNNYTGGSPNDMTVETDPGWALDQAFDLNPTGNSVHWQGGGEDGELDFPSVSGIGTSIYLSFLLDVKGWDTTLQGHAPDNYRHINLGINDSGNVGSGLAIGPSTTPGDMKFRIGLMNSDNTGTDDVAWFPTAFTYTDLGTASPTLNQFFIVIKYTIGDGTGLGEMWVNPAISSGEPTPDVTHVAVNKVRSSFQSVLLQASSNNRNPDNFTDEIRVAGSWEEALGLPPLSVSENELASSLKIFPNPARDYFDIKTNNVEISSVELFNVLGSKVLTTSTNRINVSGLTSGIYFAKINADGASVTRKIIIE